MSLIPYFSLLFMLAFFTAIYLSIERLCQDNELSSAMALGYSFSDLLRSLLPLVTIGAIIFSLASFYLEPWGRHNLKTFLYDQAEASIDAAISTRLRPGVLSESMLGFVFYAHNYAEAEQAYKDVFIFPDQGYFKEGKDTLGLSPAQEDGSSYFLTAKQVWFSGKAVKANLRMHFREASVYSYKNAGEDFSISKFESLDVDPLEFFATAAPKRYAVDKDPRNYNIAELYHSFTEPNKLLDAKTRHKSAYIFYSKIGDIALFFALVLLAIIFAIYPLREKQRLAALNCLWTLIAIYLLVHLFKFLDKFNIIPISICAVAAQVLVLISAVVLYRRRSKLALWDKLFF